MLQKSFLIGVFISGCVALPMLHQLNPGAIERWYASVTDESSPPPTIEQKPARTAAIAVTRMAPAPASEPMLGRKALVRPDPRGHFVAEFRLNGRAVEAMIDTGATVIAINRATARRIGVAVANADFKYEVRTANGIAKAAVVSIDRVQIGKISLDGIEAMVLDDGALDGVLIGMSFLQRLSKFQVEQGALVLQQ